MIGLAVDPEAAMLEYLEMFYSIKRGGSMLRKMGAIDFVTTIAPGLRDVLLTGKVKEAVTRTTRARPAFDAVVLDAPPTGRITQFLQATHEVAGLTKIGPIHQQSAGVIDLLHSRADPVHIVTLLEEMPVQETLDAAAELRAAGYRLGQVIVNRARPVLVSARQTGARPCWPRGCARPAWTPTFGPALAEHRRLRRRPGRPGTGGRANWRRSPRPIRRLPELAPPMDLGEPVRAGRDSGPAEGRHEPARQRRRLRRRRAAGGSGPEGHRHLRQRRGRQDHDRGRARRCGRPSRAGKWWC